jgi:hypothetical protein
MKIYKNDMKPANIVHTIKVTLQYMQYKGYFTYEVGGNCLGIEVMDFGFDCFGPDDIDGLKENDCQISFDEDYDCFNVVLKDEDGNECACSDLDERDISEMVIGIEIIDWRKGSRKEDEEVDG